VIIYISFIDSDIINDSLSANILGGVGVLSLIVAIMGVCPLYSLADINTRCQKQKQKDK